MTDITSVVRLNTDRAVDLIIRAAQRLDTPRTHASARNHIRDAVTFIENSLDKLVVPATSFPLTTRIMTFAVCILYDYFNQFVGEQVIIPPPSSNVPMSSDMAAISALVKRSDATHRAISNGNWTNGAIWSTGTVPGAGARVFISAARNVTYNVSTAAAVCVKTIGNFGTLSVSKTVPNVRFLADTIVNAGNFRASVPDNATLSVEFAGGSIDTSWDPRLISRGFLSFGPVSIVGKYRKPFIAVDQRGIVGSTSVCLTSAHVGWAAGDRVIPVPTRINPAWEKSNNTTDPLASVILRRPAGLTSIKTISQIIGNRVLFTTPCEYDYTVPEYVTNAPTGQRNNMKRTGYLANISRNIIFRTFGASAPFWRRGHFIQMHGGTLIRNVGFHGMGRTNKDYDTHSIDNLFANASLNSVSPITPPRIVASARANIRGRYPIHLHLVGVGVGGRGRVDGCYVSSTPGWGITQHDTFADINNNIVYLYNGGGIVSETANEPGKWIGNLVMGATTPRRSGLKDGVLTNDIINAGVAFGMTSRNLSVVGNVAAGWSTEAFGFINRPNGIGSFLESPASVLSPPEIAMYDSSVNVERIPIKFFAKNRAIAGHRVFNIFKGTPFQHSQFRTYLTSILAWDVIAGPIAQYTSHYTFKDWEVIAKPTWTNPRTRADNSFEIHESADMVMTSCYFRKFQNGGQWRLRTAGNNPTHQFPVKSHRIDGVDVFVTNFHGDYFLDSVMASLQSATTPLHTGAAFPQVLVANRSTLQNNGTLSVVYSSAVRHGRTWISFDAFPKNNTSQEARTIEGSIRDSISWTKYPMVVQQDRHMDAWNETKGVINAARNIIRNFGYFRVSNAQRQQNYVVIRNFFADRINAHQLEYRQYGWRVSVAGNLLTSIAGVLTTSITRIATVTTITSISVPAWTGLARNFS